MNQGYVLLIGLVLRDCDAEEEFDILRMILTLPEVDDLHVVDYLDYGSLHDSNVDLLDQTLVSFVKHVEQFGLPNFLGTPDLLNNLDLLGDDLGVFEALLAEEEEKLETFLEGMSLFPAQFVDILAVEKVVVGGEEIEDDLVDIQIL